MKRLIFSLLISLITISAFAKKDVTKFLGIPVDGTKSEMIQKLRTLEDAIDKAISLKPDVVLLSPACASFDAYPNFVARGNHFKQLVKEL